MAVSLVNNLSSSASQTRLNASGAKLNQTIQRLSSGLRINNSADAENGPAEIATCSVGPDRQGRPLAPAGAAVDAVRQRPDGCTTATGADRA